MSETVIVASRKVDVYVERPDGGCDQFEDRVLPESPGDGRDGVFVDFGGEPPVGVVVTPVFDCAGVWVRNEVRLRYPKKDGR